MVLIIMVFISAAVCAQDSDTISLKLPNRESKDLGLVFGLHQFRNTYIELGVSRSKSKGGCVWGSYFYGTSLSAEYNPFQNRLGAVISGWSSLATFIIVGANMHSYTNFDNWNLGIKPFVGIGPGNISFTYGYHFQLVDNGVTGINRHCFSLRYHLGIKQIN